MVFCYQNCSDLQWEKICSSVWEIILKFKAEGREFSKILRSLEWFIQTVKGQNNFWNRMLFKLIPRCFKHLINSGKLETFEFKFEKTVEI